MKRARRHAFSSVAEKHRAIDVGALLRRLDPFLSLGPDVSARERGVSLLRLCLEDYLSRCGSGPAVDWIESMLRLAQTREMEEFNDVEISKLLVKGLETEDQDRLACVLNCMYVWTVENGKRNYGAEETLSGFVPVLLVSSVLVVESFLRLMWVIEIHDYTAFFSSRISSVKLMAALGLAKRMAFEMHCESAPVQIDWIEPVAFALYIAFFSKSIQTVDIEIFAKDHLVQPLCYALLLSVTGCSKELVTQIWSVEVVGGSISMILDFLFRWVEMELGYPSFVLATLTKLTLFGCWKVENIETAICIWRKVAFHDSKMASNAFGAILSSALETGIDMKISAGIYEESFCCGVISYVQSMVGELCVGPNMASGFAELISALLKCGDEFRISLVYEFLKGREIILNFVKPVFCESAMNVKILGMMRSEMWNDEVVCFFRRLMSSEDAELGIEAWLALINANVEIVDDFKVGMNLLKRISPYKERTGMILSRLAERCDFGKMDSEDITFMLETFIASGYSELRRKGLILLLKNGDCEIWKSLLDAENVPADFEEYRKKIILVSKAISVNSVEISLYFLMGLMHVPFRLFQLELIPIISGLDGIVWSLFWKLWNRFYCCVCVHNVDFDMEESVRQETKTSKGSMLAAFLSKEKYQKQQICVNRGLSLNREILREDIIPKRVLFSLLAECHGCLERNDGIYEEFVSRFLLEEKTEAFRVLSRVSVSGIDPEIESQIRDRVRDSLHTGNPDFRDVVLDVLYQLPSMKKFEIWRQTFQDVLDDKKWSDALQHLQISEEAEEISDIFAAIFYSRATGRNIGCSRAFLIALGSKSIPSSIWKNMFSIALHRCSSRIRNVSSTIVEEHGDFYISTGALKFIDAVVECVGFYLPYSSLMHIASIVATYFSKTIVSRLPRKIQSLVFGLLNRIIMLNSEEKDVLIFLLDSKEFNEGWKSMLCLERLAPGFIELASTISQSGSQGRMFVSRFYSSFLNSLLLEPSIDVIDLVVQIIPNGNEIETVQKIFDALQSFPSQHMILLKGLLYIGNNGFDWNEWSGCNRFAATCLHTLSSDRSCRYVCLELLAQLPSQYVLGDDNMVRNPSFRVLSDLLVRSSPGTQGRRLLFKLWHAISRGRPQLEGVVSIIEEMESDEGFRGPLLSERFSTICSVVGWTLIGKYAMGSVSTKPSLTKLHQSFQVLENMLENARLNGLGDLAGETFFSSFVNWLRIKCFSECEDTLRNHFLGLLSRVIRSVDGVVSSEFKYALIGNGDDDQNVLSWLCNIQLKLRLKSLHRLESCLDIISEKEARMWILPLAFAASGLANSVALDSRYSGIQDTSLGLIAKLKPRIVLVLDAVEISLGIPGKNEHHGIVRLGSFLRIPYPTCHSKALIRLLAMCLSVCDTQLSTDFFERIAQFLFNSEKGKLRLFLAGSAVECALKTYPQHLMILLDLILPLLKSRDATIRTEARSIIATAAIDSTFLLILLPRVHALIAPVSSEQFAEQCSSIDTIDPVISSRVSHETPMIPILGYAFYEFLKRVNVIEDVISIRRLIYVFFQAAFCDDKSKTRESKEKKWPECFYLLSLKVPLGIFLDEFERMYGGGLSTGRNPEVLKSILFRIAEGIRSRNLEEEDLVLVLHLSFKFLQENGFVAFHGISLLNSILTKLTLDNFSKYVSLLEPIGSFLVNFVTKGKSQDSSLLGDAIGALTRLSKFPLRSILCGGSLAITRRILVMVTKERVLESGTPLMSRAFNWISQVLGNRINEKKDGQNISRENIGFEEFVIRPVYIGEQEIEKLISSRLIPGLQDWRITSGVLFDVVTELISRDLPYSSGSLLILVGEGLIPAIIQSHSKVRDWERMWKSISKWIAVYPFSDIEEKQRLVRHLVSQLETPNREGRDAILGLLIKLWKTSPETMVSVLEPLILQLMLSLSRNGIEQKGREFLNDLLNGRSCKLYFRLVDAWIVELKTRKTESDCREEGDDHYMLSKEKKEEEAFCSQMMSLVVTGLTVLTDVSENMDRHDVPRSLLKKVHSIVSMDPRVAGLVARMAGLVNKED